MTTYTVHDLASSKGVSEPVRQALLGLQVKLNRQATMLEQARAELHVAYLGRSRAAYLAAIDRIDKATPTTARGAE